MHSSLADKARAGRRAALSALNARLGTTDRVVSIFEGTLPRRRAVPEFHSVRHPGATPATAPLPILVLNEPVAA